MPRESKEIDVLKLSELEDIANGVDGSSGDVSLSPDLLEVYEALGGDIEDTIDTGSGAAMVPCQTLCNLVLGEIEETDGKTRRTVQNLPAKRKEGAAAKIRKDSKKRKAAEEPVKNRRTAADPNS